MHTVEYGEERPEQHALAEENVAWGTGEVTGPGAVWPEDVSAPQAVQAAAQQPAQAPDSQPDSLEERQQQQQQQQQEQERLALIASWLRCSTVETCAQLPSVPDNVRAVGGAWYSNVHVLFCSVLFCSVSYFILHSDLAASSMQVAPSVTSRLEQPAG